MIDEDALQRSLALSADQISRLKTFERAIQRWSSVKNLVSGAALEDLWARHILDSAQVQRSAPQARVWVDLGSGGGFPGIVTAILLAEFEHEVHLVEFRQPKMRFPSLCFT